MPLTVDLYHVGKSESARRLAEEVENSGMADHTRQEPGNEKYDCFVPMNSSETTLLIGSWKNQKSLDAHHASPMMKELADLREEYDLHMHAERHVSDESGMPSTDQKFIRKQ